jgi:hypothetical protein
MTVMGFAASKCCFAPRDLDLGGPYLCRVMYDRFCGVPDDECIIEGAPLG